MSFPTMFQTFYEFMPSMDQGIGGNIHQKTINYNLHLTWQEAKEIQVEWGGSFQETMGGGDKVLGLH